MAHLAHTPTPCKLAGAASVSGYSHRERDDTYGKVIVHLAPRWRIIECRAAKQWIIQKRSAEPLHSGIWRGSSYITDRDKLIELSATLGLLSDPSLRAVLEALPSNANKLRK
jgi:hypothetical protein